MKSQYIVIQKWMLEDLKLAGTELIIFSVIYGFSQDGESKFTGSLQYLADWSCSTKQSVQNNLKKLLDKDFIVKKDKIVNGVKFCEYSANLHTIQKICMGYTKNLHGGIQKICNNNIDDNIDNNIDNSCTSATKKRIYHVLLEELIRKEVYLMQICQKFGTTKQNAILLLTHFTNIDRQRIGSEIDFKSHFENWVSTDNGQKALSELKKENNKYIDRRQM